MQKPFFRNTPYYGLYTATPYHQHSPFGDGQTGSPRGLGHVMYVFSTLTQDPYFRWHAQESGVTIGADALSLATYDPKLQARSPLELPGARSFPAVGLASFHTALGDQDSDISFLMRSSPYGGVSHGHADQNAYVIEAFGRGSGHRHGLLSLVRFAAPRPVDAGHPGGQQHPGGRPGAGPATVGSQRPADGVSTSVGRLRLRRGRGGPGLRGTPGTLPPPRGPRTARQSSSCSTTCAPPSRRDSSGSCTPTIASRSPRRTSVLRIVNAPGGDERASLAAGPRRASRRRIATSRNRNRSPGNGRTRGT